MTCQRPCFDRLALVVAVIILASAATGRAQESSGSFAAGLATANFGTTGFFGEAAFNTSDTMAVAGRVQYFGFGIGSYTRLEGGVRIYGQPNDIRPFGQFMAGLARVAVGGFDFFGESAASANAFALSPGGGVELEVNERIALRVLGEWQMNISSGGTGGAIGVLFGLAFDFGDQ